MHHTELLGLHQIGKDRCQLNNVLYFRMHRLSIVFYFPQTHIVEELQYRLATSCSRHRIIVSQGLVECVLRCAMANIVATGVLSFLAVVNWRNFGLDVFTMVVFCIAGYVFAIESVCISELESVCVLRTSLVASAQFGLHSGPLVYFYNDVLLSLCLFVYLTVFNVG